MRKHGKYVVVNDDGMFRCVFERFEDAKKACDEQFKRHREEGAEMWWIIYPE